MSTIVRQTGEHVVLDRTRPVKRRAAYSATTGKPRVSLPFEVCLYATESAFEEDVPEVLARFLHAGDAFLYAKSLRFDWGGCHCLVVRS